MGKASSRKRARALLRTVGPLLDVTTGRPAMPSPASKP